METVYLPLNEHLDLDKWPFGGFFVDAAKHIYFTPPETDLLTEDTIIGISPPVDLSIKIPGLDFLKLGLGPAGGSLIYARLNPLRLAISILAELTLQVRCDVLMPLKEGTNEPDTTVEWLSIPLAETEVKITSEGNVSFNVKDGLSLPRCMIGTSGVILNIGKLRWLTPETDLTNDPSIAANIPIGFNGLYLENVNIEIVGLPIDRRFGRLQMPHGYIGTGGFTGEVVWEDPSVTWNGTGSSGSFSGLVAGKIFDFTGVLNKVKITFRQNTLTVCEIEGNVFVPYLDKVIGLSLGFDGNGALTAIAQGPTCTFTNDEHKAVPAPEGFGYILTADTKAFTLNISRIEFHAGVGEPASLSLAGRVKLKASAFPDLPAVVFKGLRIDTEGHVAVEGGWLDVDKAKASSLKGFPFQITKIGFGAETDGRRWMGLNGGIKLADGLPIGASVEGLRVTWNPSNNDISFALEGIGLELTVPKTFSFAGKVAFFDTPEATGFRGSVKLELTTLKLKIDAGMVVGQACDGTNFFFLFLDIELPVGIPLFSSGTAIYGFAGLLATNLKPSRTDGEDWYYGYYRRPPVGVTDSSKWSVQRDSFAIGLGTTIGSLPDTGFAFSAKVLLVLVLPGPQLLLQGKGQFIKQKPETKDPSSEGNFEALLVLDVPAKLFQANLAAAFKIPSLVEIAGGVNVAFTWATNPPPDLWHIYLGEKKPAERRIHAKLFKFLQGDSWLMINRPGTLAKIKEQLDAERLGELEMGGSLGVKLEFDFTIIKAWLEASIVGQAAVSWDPQQFYGTLTLKGSAGVSVLGASIVLDLLADARVKAPSPWHLAVDLELYFKIDLLVTKWEFRKSLPLRFGDEHSPLPEPIIDLVTLSADHAKADEAMSLPATLVPPMLPPIVPPDVRPLVVFKRPVQDRARFGSPGRDNLPSEDLGLRQVSYQLRHIVLLARDAAGLRLVGAAGELTVSGNTATFPGLAADGDRLPDMSGATITLFREGLAPTSGLSISAGSGDSATIAGTPPEGTFSYRLSAPRPAVTIQIGSVGSATTGEVVVTVVNAIADPSRFRGGSLMVSSASWLILEATTTTVRIRVTDTLPSNGAGTLLGPKPAALEGKWAPTGDPVTDSDSSTRLQVWARTPFAFYRHNELASIEGLDAFKPEYACGPEATEEPTCTQFEEVMPGQLNGNFSTAGISGVASGFVAAVPSGRTTAIHLQLGELVSGHGTVIFTFDPPVDAVWITGNQQEAGFIKVSRDGISRPKVYLERKISTLQFTGGIDQVEVSGLLASLYKLCFLPGWSCIHFEAESFPQGKSGEISYAGLMLVSGGVMTVVAGMLEIDHLELSPPVHNITVVFPRPVTRVRITLGSSAYVEAFAGSEQVCGGMGGSGTNVSLYADPTAAPHIGWIDRIVVTATSRVQVRLSEICFDAGNLGWARHEKWTWSQGVQRSVESLYQPDPVLPPGEYEMRVHTAAVVTGEQPIERLETTRGIFTVGTPAGFPVAPPGGTGSEVARYPHGGPLTQLDTYVQRTMPAAGAALWYRNYDTAVGFNESYVTRMYLDAGHDLRVFVVNASGVAIRSDIRHVWSGADANIDAWTTQYIRTLNGDGTDRCASVELDRVVRPESVTAGGGEPLEPASLHASELRSAASPSRVLHRFEFVTSQYFSFRHHIATFDGRCRRLTPDPASLIAAVPPRVQAGTLNGLQADLLTAIRTAIDAKARADSDVATTADLDSATAAIAALAQRRRDSATKAAAVFEEIWQACFAATNPPALPSAVRLSVILAVPGTDVLLLESPEPIAWDRVSVSAVADTSIITN